MTKYTFTVAAFYDNIEIEADDAEEAEEIAIMTIRDRWYDDVIAARMDLNDSNDA